MLRRLSLVAVTAFSWQAAACQSGSASSNPVAARRAIEVRDGGGTVTARVVIGHPCRATVDGMELIVGGRPLIAQLGSARWTGEDGPNGTTLKKNDAAVARIHANQLFDAEGVPLVRVMDNGDISNPAGQIVRKAIVMAGFSPTITIGDVTVTGTIDVPLAAMLTAPGVGPEIRALAACHYLLPETKS